MAEAFKGSNYKVEIVGDRASVFKASPAAAPGEKWRLIGGRYELPLEKTDLEGQTWTAVLLDINKPELRDRLIRIKPKKAEHKQAVYFMSRLNVSREELEKTGANCVNSTWTFPDGSRGRFMPFDGRFIALEDDEVTRASQIIEDYLAHGRPYLALDLDDKQARFLSQDELTRKNVNQPVALFDLRHPDATKVSRDFIPGSDHHWTGGRQEAVERLAAVVDKVECIP